MPDDVSRLRQRLRAASHQHSDQLDLFVRESPGLVRGTFGTRSRVCGKPGCKCADGELHESKYLSAAVGGQARQVHVPAGDEVMVSDGVDRYRRWRRMRGELIESAARQLQLVYALGNALLRPYPADDPIPPAGKRGRKPATKGRRG